MFNQESFMDRASIPISRFLAAAGIIAAGALAACEPQSSVTYDPRIDGILPQQMVSAEPGILDDQTALHPAANLSRGGAPAGGTTTPPAPANGNPPPPPETPPPPPPPPSEEAAPAAPAPAAPAPEKAPASAPAEVEPAAPG
jgi:hypothetical protein